MSYKVLYQAGQDEIEKKNPVSSHTRSRSPRKKKQLTS